ncbi:hypothetical protein MTP99_005202 [Tenebrio molitor]|nr:hypothetical protein MTP99_005202 [Tenebrio molitor]
MSSGSFLLYFFSFYLSTAFGEVIFCYVKIKEEGHRHHSNHHMVFCDSAKEKCCEEGCCSATPMIYYILGAIWLVGIIIIGLTFCYCSKQKCKKKITPGESELEMRENSRRCAASAPPLSIISGSDLRPNDDLPTYEEAVAQKKDLTIR